MDVALASKSGEGFFSWRAPFIFTAFILLIAFISAVDVVNFDSSVSSPTENEKVSNSDLKLPTETSDKIVSEEDKFVERDGKKYVVRNGKEYLASGSDYYIKFNPALPSSICANKKIIINFSGEGKYSPTAVDLSNCAIYGYVSVGWCVDLMEYDPWPNPDDFVSMSCGYSETYDEDCAKFNFVGTFNGIANEGVDLSKFIIEDSGSEGEFYAKVYGATSSDRVTEMSSDSSDVSIRVPQPHYGYGCNGDDVYWFDDCGNWHEKKNECGTSEYVGGNYCYDNDVYRNYLSNGCSGNSCFANTKKELQMDCGEDSCETWGANYCNGGNVYHSRTCNRQGCSMGNCFSRNGIEEEKVSDCLNGCESGQCADIKCSKNSDCGTDSWIGYAFCSDNDLYQSWRTYTCNNLGTVQSSCSDSDLNKLKQDCGNSGYIGSNYCYDNDVYKDYLNKGCSGNSCFSTAEKIKQTECGTLGCDSDTNNCKSTTTCTPGQKRCSGNNIETCKSDGSGWQISQNCGTTSYCSSDSCIACDDGKFNCNLNFDDGCEIDKLNDNNNCGSCGNVCSTGNSCQSGVCTSISSCPDSVCGGYCGSYADFPAVRFYNPTSSGERYAFYCSDKTCEYSNFEYCRYGCSDGKCLPENVGLVEMEIVDNHCASDVIIARCFTDGISDSLDLQTDIPNSQIIYSEGPIPSSKYDSKYYYYKKLGVDKNVVGNYNIECVIGSYAISREIELKSCDSEDLVISNLNPSTYKLTNLVLGSEYYLDRTYIIKSLPSLLQGSKAIITKNDLLSQTEFSVNKNVRVYLAWDMKEKSPSGWTKISDKVLVSDKKASDGGYLQLLYKDFSVGKVVVPKKNSKSNYIIFVSARSGDSGLAVTGLSPSQYKITTLSKGSNYYTDRTLTITKDLPTILKDHIAIITSQDYRTSTIFSVNKNVRVYLAWDLREKTPSGWTSTTDKIYVSDKDASNKKGYLQLIYKDFNSGSVSVPKKINKSNYIIFVVKK